MRTPDSSPIPKNSHPICSQQPASRAKLIALKDFEYADPGMDYPSWKLDAVNRLKDRMIGAILA